MGGLFGEVGGVVVAFPEGRGDTPLGGDEGPEVLNGGAEAGGMTQLEGFRHKPCGRWKMVFRCNVHDFSPLVYRRRKSTPVCVRYCTSGENLEARKKGDFCGKSWGMRGRRLETAMFGSDLTF